MARCGNCNAVMNNSAKFCSRCGAALAAPATVAAPPAAETGTATAPPVPRIPLTAMELLATPPPPVPARPAFDPDLAAMGPQTVTMNPFAIASFILGLTWVFWLGSVLAIIFGFVAVSQIDSSRGTQRGRVLAIVGIVLGVLAIAVFVLAVIVAAISDSGTSSRLG